MAAFCRIHYPRARAPAGRAFSAVRTQPVPPLSASSPMIPSSDALSGRELAMRAWLQSLPQGQHLNLDALHLAAQDVGTRRYFRLPSTDGTSRIVMDAPPASNDVAAFVRVAAQLQACGLHAPAIMALEPEAGFMLLEDLGPQTYLTALLKADTAEQDRLMRAAIGALVQWQVGADATQLPVYDEAFVRRELDLFKTWCVEREFARQWDARQLGWWQHSCQVLVDNALQQPQLAMHRDYMVRNLMVCEPLPGILDFQDAVRGPIAYDLASLLRDAFISWDEAQELDWAVRYWEQARAAGLPVEADFGEFWRMVEWSGLQRHLKILGIFCRLKHRDQRPAYSADLPRLFAYAIKVTTRYVQLSPLTHLLQDLQGNLVQTGFDLR